jgi:hypothetical protein
MSKPSRNPRRHELNEQKHARRQAARKLRKLQAAAGLQRQVTTTLSNGKSELTTVEQERTARQEAVEEQLKTFRAVLPDLLKRLARIPDPRNPKTVKHQLTVVLLYGLLTFVFQMASRREANREMSLPVFLENLRLLFPELESLPHHDTLNRLLAAIEVQALEEAHVERIERLIRNKKFQRYLVANRYPIAVDGTQKFARNYRWDEQCLERAVRSKEGEESETRKYYVYVLEANLALPNGMTIPLMSEFLSYTEGDQLNNKQDCELRAFRRLAERLKEYFPRLPILVLLDGLYANGPVIELCRRYQWDYMIVLQDDSLSSVWEEVNGLIKILPEQHRRQNWGNRRQHFWWVNDIEYRYGQNDRQKQILHVVVCEESWEEVDLDSAQIVAKTSRHAWISGRPLHRDNVHERCNLGARYRWAIESNILVEKHHGYQYQHCFSFNWKAMKGYHYLMRLAHLINVLAQNTVYLARLVRCRGVRGVIKFLRETIAGPWLDAEKIRTLLNIPHQLRLE